MALLTSQLGMRSLAREARRGMVELPVRPSIGIMTSSAPVAECPLVVVVRLVARDALGWRTAVTAVSMALFAAHGSMQTHQREAGEIVIEADLVAPARLAMTSGAIPPHATGVYVIGLMAAEALFGKLLRLGAGRVASVASQLLVFAVQRVLVLGEMVVFHRLPAIRLVAGGAVVTKAAGMGVFRRVAAVTGLRQLRLQVAIFVASVAGNFSVLTVQAKAGFFQVVKAGVLPTHRAVTVLASRPARTAMNVIGCVASIAGGGRALESGIAVTSRTGNLVMGTQQGELGLAVIEVHGLEALHIVALGAVGAELAKVDVIRLVAGNTLVRSVAVLFAGLVARSASHSGMRAFQLEIGLLVAESVGLEPDDVCRPTLVLAMATRAAGVCRQSAAMETLTALHVRGDVFVACQTQIAHARLVGTVVATGALLFVLGVGRRKLAGHEERFQGSRCGQPRRKQQACRHYRLQTTHETPVPEPTEETAKPRATLQGVRGLKADLR